ncbi:hypothetical protein CROQUDRAFT_672291 [Cronartium quercuum f. sp. fusiforme G11]|uniref:Velvet domain-containing protein n=1 Tax=Cronartium quercuum f. sp. fusiforme G11 TaxID=708437 RepID=A0A9P6NDB0_9BASI|nr:hypothetical protein CROQUDRAFT_672291 [Cronartium quercuum f. sp. fusiforme G11]
MQSSSTPPPLPATGSDSTPAPSLPRRNPRTVPPSSGPGPGPGTTELPYKFIPTVQKTDHRDKIKYHIEICQQPQRSRMVGSGDKSDRRPIDPPPIVQLSVEDMSQKRMGSDDTINDITLLRSPNFICYATLCVADGPPFTELVKLPNSRKPYVVGGVVSSLFHLREAQLPGRDGHFFVFGDLGVRVEGRYRLKMSVYEIVGEKVWFCASTQTEPFEVFSAKKFPGMEESTEMSRSFANQGIRLRVRTKSQLQPGQTSSERATSTARGRKKQRIAGPVAKAIMPTFPTLTTNAESSQLVAPLTTLTHAPRFEFSHSLPPSLPSLRSMLLGVLPSDTNQLHPPPSRQSHPLLMHSAPHSPVSSSPSSSSSVANVSLQPGHILNSSSTGSDPPYLAYGRPSHPS